MEACLVRNVWPANLKKRQTRTKRFVPLVHRAITRTRQTWTRASNAHLGMPNRRPGKRRAFPASKENTTMSKVRRRASNAKPTPIPWTKTEPPNAFHVRPVETPRKEVQNALIAQTAEQRVVKVNLSIVLIAKPDFMLPLVMILAMYARLVSIKIKA